MSISSKSYYLGSYVAQVSYYENLREGKYPPFNFLASIKAEFFCQKDVLANMT